MRSQLYFKYYTMESYPIFSIPELMFRLFAFCSESLSVLYMLNHLFREIVYGYILHNYNGVIINKKTILSEMRVLNNIDLLSFYVKNNLLFCLRHMTTELRYLTVRHYQEACCIGNLHMIKFLFSTHVTPLIFSDEIIVCKFNPHRYLYKLLVYVNEKKNTNVFNYLLSCLCEYKDIANYFQYCVANSDLKMINYFLENNVIREKTLRKAFRQALLGNTECCVLELLMDYVTEKFMYVHVIKKYLCKISSHKIILIINHRPMLKWRIFVAYLEKNLQGFFKRNTSPENNVKFFEEFIPDLQLQSKMLSSDMWIDLFLHKICTMWEHYLNYNDSNQVTAEMLFWTLVRRTNKKLDCDFFYSFRLLRRLFYQKYYSGEK